MTEEQFNSIANILGTICAILFVIAMILGCIYLFIYCGKTDKMKQDYIKSLDEHDKSIIATYKNTYWTWRKKSNDKDVSH